MLAEVVADLVRILRPTEEFWFLGWHCCWGDVHIRGLLCRLDGGGNDT